MIRQYELVEAVKAYDPHADEDLLNRAYVFAMKERRAPRRLPRRRIVGQVRVGGEVFARRIEHLHRRFAAADDLHFAVAQLVEHGPDARAAHCSADCGKRLRGRVEEFRRIQGIAVRQFTAGQQDFAVVEQHGAVEGARHAQAARHDGEAVGRGVINFGAAIGAAARDQDAAIA